MTKKQEAMLQAYLRADEKATDLWRVYGTFSKKKAEAMEYCKELQYRLNGYGGRITSANSYHFSYAFKYPDYDTGKMCLCYCTAAHDYKFPIE